MNIKFGMDNFYVKYLKRFINHELDMPTSLLGKFDKNDLKLLIKYLNLPNVKNMFEVQKEALIKFPQLKTLFNSQLRDNLIIYSSKNIDDDTSTFLNDNIDKIREYCESIGWEVANIKSWIDISKDVNQDGNVNSEDRRIIYDIIQGNASNYDEETVKKADLNLDGVVDYKDLAILDDYLLSGKLYLVLQQSNRKNYFPNKDMLVFINQFDGTFLYNFAIRDGRPDTIDDVPHQNNDGIFKIALYECTPGQKVTIAHDSSQPVRLVIGGSRANTKSGIENLELSNVVDVILKAGDYIQYTCTSKQEGTGPDVHYLCIQCPSDYNDIAGTTTKTLQLDTGDINFDGVIDMDDYHLLARYTATGPGSEEYKWTPTAKQLAVMNVRKDETDPDITVRDAEYLYRFIMGDPAIPSLGVSFFDIEVNSESSTSSNVNNLLIIDGHYDTDVNIPFKDFITDDWVVHEKFFNYLLGMAIHKYSNTEDISYLQKLLKEYYPEYKFNKEYFNTGLYSEYMQSLVKDFQTSNISYTTGDLNKDNTLSYADLEILRNYIDDSTDYTLVQKYITDPERYPLSSEEITRLDQNGDGVIDDADLKILDEALSKNYSELLRSRADINDDGFVDEADYIALKDILDNGYTIIYDTISGKERKIDLKQYDISFILGWLDVPTEALMEKTINIYGDISEVSK